MANSIRYLYFSFPKQIILIRFLIIFIAIANILVSTRQTFVVCYFLVNQENISKTLCIQKDLKVNTCHGKCHLKKQLNDEDNSPSKPFEKTRSFLLEDSMILKSFNLDSTVQSLGNKLVFKNQISYYFLFSKQLLKPPGFFS